MTANHVEHEIATFPGSSGARPGPAIAYSTVGTGRTPSAVPSSSNFPASHSDSEPGLIAQSYRTFFIFATRPTYAGCAGSSGDLPPPPLQAEKATARRDEARKSCTDDGTGE